jgi:hypothetical protein
MKTFLIAPALVTSLALTAVQAAETWARGS